MSKQATQNTLESAAEAVLLGYNLFRHMDLQLMEDILSGPILLETLPEVPSWITIEAFIQKNPELLSTNQMKKWWKERNDNPLAQMNLLQAFKENYSAPKEIILVEPHVRQDTEFREQFLELGTEVVKILGDQKYSEMDKREKLITFLSQRIGG